MHLLDTDTLTHLHAGSPHVVKHLQKLTDSNVGTTVVTKIELLRGRFKFVLKANTGPQLLRAQELLTRTEELLSQMMIVSFDRTAIEHFERLRTNNKLGKIGRADLLIASIALAQQATLVTRNLRHFRQIPGLRVINWVD